MNPWLNYHHLLYFKTIAEEGSVSRAAVKLRLGQPTLSSQLKQFEEHLGVLLFERQHKKLVLTEQGEIALDYAKNIFKMGSEMVEVLHDRMRPLQPPLHLGALDSIPKQIILQLVQHALEVSPCQISLSEGKADELLRELTAHRIDIVVTNFLPTGIDAKGLFPKSISKENVKIYGAAKFKNLRKGFPQSLSKQPLILPTYDSKLRQDLDHWAQVHQIEMNLITESPDIAVKVLMAVHGMGLIATTSLTVAQHLKNGELIEVGALQGVREELFLVTSQRRIENSIAAKMMKTFSI